MKITAQMILDAFDDQGFAYISPYIEGDLSVVCLDGDVNFEQLAEFLNLKAMAESDDKIEENPQS